MAKNFLKINKKKGESQRYKTIEENQVEISKYLKFII